MGMDLRGTERDYSVNHSGWKSLIRLALRYGWWPAGTVAGEDGECPPHARALEFTGVAIQKTAFDALCVGGYFSNDWQVVTDSDAIRMAMALERAVSDLLRYGQFRPPFPKADIGFGQHNVEDLTHRVQIESLNEFTHFARTSGFAIG
jgi:hypothetical protein